VKAVPGPSFDYGSWGRVGLLLPSVNRAAEPQLRAMLPAEVALAVTRLKLADASEAALLGMADQVEDASVLLADAGVDLIVFHCTAVSTYSGQLEQSILRRIESASGRPALATSQSLVDALRAQDARRLVMLSPYRDDVNERERKYFEANGFDVVSCKGRGCLTAPEMMAITPGEWLAMARAEAGLGAQALVLSCTTTRALEAVEAIEESLGIPVVTSNSAVAWSCQKALRCRRPIAGFGALLRLQWNK
jgi:maleate isomerase